MSRPASRRVKQATYRSFRLSKRLKTTRPHLPSSWSLLKGSLQVLRDNWKLFGGISLVYGLLAMFLVRGLNGGYDLVETKSLLQETLGVNNNNLVNSVALFGDLLGGAQTTPSETAALYQTILIIICGLATLWALRQVYGHKKSEVAKLRTRDAFYKGMYPLVPVLLVLLVLSLQLLPIAIASGVYSTMIVSGLAVTAIEKTVWLVLVGLLIVLSLYMVSASLFSVFIASLPDVTPIEALRGARKYVEHRRLQVFGKLLWMAVLVLLVLALVVLPLIAFIPAVAELVFFLLSVVMLPVIITYMYNLYRALIA